MSVCLGYGANFKIIFYLSAVSTFHPKRDVGCRSAYEVVQMKGHTNWATGMMVSKLCGCILRNEHRPFCLTTNVKVSRSLQRHFEMYLSLPLFRILKLEQLTYL